MPTLWPFIPRDEWTEGLEWRSDVIRPFSTEQRIRLLNSPRIRLNFPHHFSARDYQRARLLHRAGTLDLFIVPLWQYKQTVTVSSGATTVTVDTTTSDYRNAGYAVLWTDAETCEAVTIGTVSSGSFTCSAASRTYTAGLVMPAVLAWCVGGLEAERSVEAHTGASLEFLSADGADLSNAGLYATSYRSHPVITDDAVLGSSSVNLVDEWPYDETDNGLSAEPFRDSTQETPAYAVPMAWYTATMADAWAVRRFLHSRYGTQKGFWLPDWHSGITVTANITSAGTTITIQAIGLDGVAETGDLMVVSTAGVQYYFRFTSVAVSSTNEVLTLSAAAGVNLTTAQIERACFLHFCRLADDRVEFQHRNPSHCSVSVLCTEVPYA